MVVSSLERQTQGGESRGTAGEEREGNQEFCSAQVKFQMLLDIQIEVLSVPGRGANRFLSEKSSLSSFEHNM